MRPSIVFVFPLLLVVWGSVLLSSCGRNQDAQAGAAAAAEIPTVAVAKAVNADLSRDLILTAEFKPFQEVDVMAKVSGYVGSGLTIGQLITDFGRTSNLIGMAKLQAAAQDQFAEATRADILLAVSSAYFAVLSAQSVLQVVDATVKARQEVVDQVTALAESKLKSTLDVSFASVNLSGARLLQVQARNELKAAEARLATAMGLPGEQAFLLVDEPMPSAVPDRVQGLIDAAIQNRPELKDLRLQQSAAERMARAEHALYFPSVGVLGAAGFAPAAVAQVPGRYGAIGINISIPIFNGGLFGARQAEAELKAKAAGENVTDLQNRVIRDVRIAWLNATTAYDRMALTRQLVQQAQLAMDLSQS